MGRMEKKKTSTGVQFLLFFVIYCFRSGPSFCLGASEEKEAGANCFV